MAKNIALGLVAFLGIGIGCQGWALNPKFQFNFKKTVQGTPATPRTPATPGTPPTPGTPGTTGNAGPKYIITHSRYGNQQTVQHRPWQHTPWLKPEPQPQLYLHKPQQQPWPTKTHQQPWQPKPHQQPWQPKPHQQPWQPKQQTHPWWIVKQKSRPWHHKPHQEPNPHDWWNSHQKKECSTFWTNWGKWSECSGKGCDYGYQIRIKKFVKICWIWIGYYRKIKKQTFKKVIKVQHQRRYCCKSVDGKWGEWGCWSACKNGYRVRHRGCCYLPIGFGKTCQGKSFEKECCEGYSDIVFSIDKSGNVPAAQLNNIFNAVVNVFNDLDKDSGSDIEKVRVGIQSFNTAQDVIRPLNDFSDEPGEAPLSVGGTNIKAALEHVGSVMFDKDNGDRDDPPNGNILVLLTDGFTQPPVGPSDIPSNVNRVIVVGLGSNIASNLKDLATTPGDFLQATFFCQIEWFLRRKLLCEKKHFPLPSSTPGCVKI